MVSTLSIAAGMQQTAGMAHRTFAAIVAAVTMLGAVLLGDAAPSTASTSPAARRVATDWTTYHGNALRTGRSTSMPMYRGGLHVVRRITLDGAVYASPIVARGLTIVVTENDTAYAFGPGNGLVWKHHLG